MSAQTFKSEVIVLRKTKLGEGDLILTCLDFEGAQIRFVAKGARKPNSTFSSRLELFAHADVLLVCGKSLDFCKEVRLIDGFSDIRGDLERSTCASALCELLSKTTEQGLGNNKLFSLTMRAMSALQNCSPELLTAVTAAALLKILAFQGFRPELNTCVLCGKFDDFNESDGSWIGFSSLEGGVICESCRSRVEYLRVEKPIIACARKLLFATFDEIESLSIYTPLNNQTSNGADGKSQGIDARFAIGVLRLCQQWSRTHVGVKIKSIDFLLSSALALPLLEDV